jgi:hypothetical protein
MDIEMQHGHGALPWTKAMNVGLDTVIQNRHGYGYAVRATQHGNGKQHG